MSTVVDTIRSANTVTQREVRESKPDQSLDRWTTWQKILFRIAFVFFIAMSIPNNPAWYRQVLSIDWLNLHYRDLYDIARFGSGINFFGNRILGSPLLGYANWIITLLVSIGAGLLWTLALAILKKEPDQYNKAYYWLRAIVRYRAGIGIIGFGFTKLLPVQMPYPSLALLNTQLGDFTAQKLYWMSIGVVPWYQIFAGIVEVGAGALLLFRKTTTLGAILLFAALGDIVYVNFAYDGGVHVYSSYFVLLAGFLLIADIPNIYNLLIREKVVSPTHHYPDLRGWKNWTRIAVKSLTIFIFLPLFFWLQYVNFRYDPYKQPSVAGVKSLRGSYAVKEFRINDVAITESATDTTRWQEVTFENWATLTFRRNKPHPLDLSNGGGDPQRDVNRTFEISGVAGGLRSYHYYADEQHNILYLEDKYKDIPDRRNIAAGVGGDGGTQNNLRNAGGAGDVPAESLTAELPGPWNSPAVRSLIRDEVNSIHPRAQSTRRAREYQKAKLNEKRNRMILHYNTGDGSNVILDGIDERGDSIYVVLQKINRSYALSNSSLQAGNY